MKDRAARRLVLGLLSRTRHGSLTLVEGSRTRRFGDREPGAPMVTVRIHDIGFYRALLKGSIGLSEAYMDRMFDCRDLPELARLAALNMPQLDRWRRGIRPLVALPQSAARWSGRNTPARSRKQISAHYDLGNDLFGLMLDPTMMYSCGIFESDDSSLHDAQIAKLDRICQKLNLSPDDHVLEIGTGWGGFAIHAAANYGCRVTTTTISAEQLALARDRVREAGLEDRITLLLEDYRNLRGSYDKLVSIEMIEAVGWQYFDTFFDQCGSLLNPDGAMLLQAITIDDAAYEVEKATRSFANTHIFPGGCLPSLKVITRSLARTGDLRAVDLEDITTHYVRTLRCWRENFLAQIDRVRALGYDGRFQRLWELYLAYCEGGFDARRISTLQLVLAKPRFVPLAPDPAPRLITAGLD
ncbi:MAG TPA: cyclopropane-fatty-acyl-phospholipid synthase family protein [Solirubrobacteraceae bacterium]|jgi:cyclopropane-fatty-acyl-phospholipid synthase|nr:cyclopropane-fatty-acyl-phospholipid synthase family protein [Solirubrobacteraceae bacterium]